MQIIIHTGAHYTDEDRLIKCLMRNADSLAPLGIAVPGPSRYRALLKKTLAALRTAPPGPEERDVLLDAILDDARSDRMILSNTHFFGAPRAAIRQGRIYPQAGERMASMCKLFPHDRVEMFIGLRNPASFLPEVYQRSPRENFEEFSGGVDPRHILWSELINRVRTEAPEVPITVWCNEDMPLIWSQIIREMAGFEPHEKVAGGFDLLASIMSKEGMQRFRAYLDGHPDLTEIQKRRVIAAFLDKFALEDEIEEELDMDGWTEDLVEEMTDLYDEDVLAIQRIPGVSLITP